MLEVMCAGSTGLPRTGGDHGILLNCWDKSSPIIKEVERTVNFAERKCGDLMQQLHFYKRYYEKWAQVERVNHTCKKKIKKCCRRTLEVDSSSENEFEKANQFLYKKIKSKINEMNNEITQANRKIHSRGENSTPRTRDSSFPRLRPEEYSQEPNNQSSLMIEHKTCKSEPMMASCDLSTTETEGLKVTKKQSSKSVPTRNKLSKNTKESGSFKRRYASLQRYKIRSKSLPQGVRRKFGFGGFIEVFEPENAAKGSSIKLRSKSKTSIRADSLKSCKSKKSKTKWSETKRLSPKSTGHLINKSKSDIRRLTNTKGEPIPQKTENVQKVIVQKPEKKEVNTCKIIVPSNSILDAPKTENALNGNLKTLIAKPNSLLPFLRQPIPFIPCSSTSKSFNLGLNIQQVLSLIKRKRHSVTLETIIKNSIQAARSATEPTVNTLFISQTTTSHSHVTSAICPAREVSEDSFSIMTENHSKCSLLKQVQQIRSQAIEVKPATPGRPILEINKVERPEDVWVVEQPDPTAREVKTSTSKCTCFPSKHCVDYHKVLRQYTGWRLPAGSHTDNQSSYMCTKAKLCAIPSRENIDFLGEESDGKTDLLKVHNDLLNLTRKYSSLQQQISQNCLDDYEVNAELDAMESELALREIEFKDILNFYNQLMVLKEKLKSLRARNEKSQSAVRQPVCQRPKKDPLRPTPSMALAKVLKKIQGLQDKIKLIDNP